MTVGGKGKSCSYFERIDHSKRSGGGGFHGKSTLLRTISMGGYDSHDYSCLSEQHGLAFPTHHMFSTKEASWSTSQASNVMEAIEFGATALLLDEDISAANFMARDGRMRYVETSQTYSYFRYQR